MAASVHLSSLSAREAIADALYRCLNGLDSNDRQLFESGWVPDGNTTFDMDGQKTEGLDALTNGMFAFIGPLDTQHMISNIRIDVKEGATTAYMTAYALAQHHRTGEGIDPTTAHLTSGSQYFLDVVKHDKDGSWRIKDWKMHIMWVDGDRSIVGL